MSKNDNLVDTSTSGLDELKASVEIQNIINTKETEYKDQFNKVYFDYNKKFIVNIPKIKINFEDNNKILILGKTGSGKSTFLDLMVGLIKPKKGEIKYFSKKKEIKSTKSDDKDEN